MLTRRRLLSQAGAVAAGSLLPFSAWSARPSVLVIGAGLSGLYAATLLEQQGFDVTVIEGRDRVGGRLFTLDDVPGQPEGGGNTIGANYGRIISQAMRLGIALEPQPRGSGMGLIIDGQKISRDEWADSPANTLPGPLRSVTPDRLRGALMRDNPLWSSTAWRLPDMQSNDVNAAEFFRAAGLDDRALHWIDVNNSYGNTLDTTSLLNLYRVGASIGRAIAMRQPPLQVQGGNMRLPEAMAAALQKQPLLGERVTQVSEQAGGVSVRCESGAEFQADRLLCALPATAVRRLELPGGMPAEQQQAFRDVVYHKITQAHLVADEPFWEATGEPGSWWTDSKLGRIFAYAMRDGSGRQNISVWINGDGTDSFDAMGEEEASNAILDEYARLVPESRGAVRSGALVRWALDPFNEGTWAIWRPGDIARMPDLLGLPHGRIHFAGEHLAVSNSGMEGAMESGERAALDIMRVLS